MEGRWVKIANRSRGKRHENLTDELAGGFARLLGGGPQDPYPAMVGDSL